MKVKGMKSAKIPGNVKIPATAFATIALFIALALLALQIVLQMELMTPELQYFCAEGQTTFCFGSFDHASTISRAPLAFLLTLSLVPAFLSVLVVRLQKNTPRHFKTWIVAAMWLAVAFYLTIPVINISFITSSLSESVTPDGWTHYPPLSLSPSSYQPEAILSSLQMNKVAVAILLLLNLFGFTIAGFSRLRATPATGIGIGFATLMIWVIWMLITRLSAFLKFVSIDQNYGTVFFDPALQPGKVYPTHLTEHLDSLAIWYVAATLCCLALWLLARRSQHY